jgi:hypothetical protein
MVNHCILRAEKLVREDNPQLIMMHDYKWFNLLVLAKLEDAWKKVTGHGVKQPNHRWNCIEGELNSQWMTKNWN